jgi:hypothetical protein
MLLTSFKLEGTQHDPSKGVFLLLYAQNHTSPGHQKGKTSQNFEENLSQF